jgi:poly(A) polymerase
LRQVLRQVVEAAYPLRVALVGGAVRDLLLHRVHNDPWRGLPDLDLVVEDHPPLPERPAAHRVAHRLRAELGPALRFCQLHEAFGTAELEIDGVLLDLATARREWYEEPGANPRVAFGSLEDDLARRDLSINAMALVLSPVLLEPEPGSRPAPEVHLLDPHGGQADLAARRLRFLHRDSLRDDPSRVVRAARYGARLGMDLEPASLLQLRETLSHWPWRGGEAGTPPALGTRLRMELDQLLGREPWPRALDLLQGWGALTLLDPGLQADRHWRRRLRWAERLLPLAALPAWPAEPWRLMALLAGLADPLAPADRLQLPHRSQQVLRGLLRLRRWLAAEQGAAAATGPAGLAVVLERHGFGPEAVLLAVVSGPPEGLANWRHWRRGLLRWLLRWRTITAPTTARELLAEGLPAGPAIGERLRALRAEQLGRERW